MQSSDIAIQVENLTKTFRVFERRVGIRGAARDLLRRRYRDLKAVDDISFQVAPGEMVGLIGPNGAGKSTTIKMLTGILVPSDGRIDVGGQVPHRDRMAYVRRIGAVFGQRTQLWWDLAVTESFHLLGKHLRRAAARSWRSGSISSTPSCPGPRRSCTRRCAS